MVNYQKEKKEIEHILLILKFGVRLTNNVKNYFKLLAKIYTPAEFFNHLTIIFTQFQIQTKKKEIELKKIYIG